MAGVAENRGKKNEKESFSLFPHVSSGISCGTGSGEGGGREGREMGGEERGAEGCSSSLSWGRVLD